MAWNIGAIGSVLAWGSSNGDNKVSDGDAFNTHHCSD